jgi:hypothetical protein
LDAAALIRSWGTWRRRRRSKRRGQTDRDREAKGVDRELLVCTPPARSRGTRKQFLGSNSAEICRGATAKKLIKFSSNWDLAHRLHQQDRRHHLRYLLLRLTLGYLLTCFAFYGVSDTHHLQPLRKPTACSLSYTFAWPIACSLWYTFAWPIACSL